MIQSNKFVSKDTDNQISSLIRELAKSTTGKDNTANKITNNKLPLTSGTGNIGNIDASYAEKEPNKGNSVLPFNIAKDKACNEFVTPQNEDKVDVKMSAEDTVNVMRVFATVPASAVTVWGQK